MELKINRVLVTGGAGYIGSHTTLALLKGERPVPAVLHFNLECTHGWD